MLNYSSEGITISTVLDTRRKDKFGNYPIKVRVTYKRKRVYYSTGKKITEQEWNNLPKSKSRASSQLRKDIQVLFDRVVDCVKNLLFDDIFNFENLNRRLGKATSYNLNVAFRAKIEALKENDQINSSFFYEYSLKKLEAYAGTDIAFETITTEWLLDYEKYLLKIGLSYTTIGMYMRAIRTIINQAKNEGIIKHSAYPFGRGKYQIPTGQKRKIALTLSQIKNIVTYSDGRETTEKARDLWFFSYLCNGINFADLVTLKYGNIQNEEIYFIRQKTARASRQKKEICVAITPEMKKIIKKWGGKNKNADNYIFGFLKGGETMLEIKKRTRDVISWNNKHLRQIGKALEIENLTTYTARHSYATVLKRSGANIAYISESLGHSDLKTTENYLASFEREERIKNAKLLTNF